MGLAITNPLATSQPQTTSTDATAQNAASSDASTSSLANQNTFLQLLVAQLQNQDPLSPEDGTQFVSQLAQLSELQQVIGIGQSVSTIATDIGSVAGSNSSPASAASAAASTSSSTTSGSTTSS
jgi:flagellar basal-body rod modification protein FlgD